MNNTIINEDLDEILSTDIPWDRLYGKTILISGANGFLPAYIVETLLWLNTRLTGKDKIEIVCIVRNKKKADERFLDKLHNPELSFVVQDISEPVVINKKIDFIIHAASQASPLYYGNDPVGTLMPNIIGTWNLLKMAVNMKVESFLFFSSGEVYGQVRDDQIPTKEDEYGYVDPMNIRSCYAESKRMGETLCKSWFTQYDVPVKIVRPFHTYGPGMSLNDGRVFADFVSNIVNNENIVLKSDGTAKRAFCYLSDATAGFFTVLLKGKDGEAYNVGYDRETSIAELAHTLVNMFPEKKLCLDWKDRSAEDNYMTSKISRGCPNIAKIAKLGWVPKKNIYDGFRRTVLSFYG